jgi:hypothetical protein
MNLLKLKGLAPQEAFFKYLEDRQTATDKFLGMLSRDPQRGRTVDNLPDDSCPLAFRVWQIKPANVDLDYLESREVVRLVEAGFQAGFILTDIVAMARLDAWEKWVWRGWNLEFPYHEMVRDVELMEIKHISEMKIILDLMGVLKLQVEVVRQTVKKLEEAVQVRQENRARLREAVDVSNFSIEELREYISSGMSSLPNRYLNPNSEEIVIEEEEADDE